MWVTRLDRTRDFVNDAYVAVRRRELARRRARSTGGPGSIPTTSTGSSRRSSPARRRARPSRSRAATSAARGEYRWLKSTSSPRFGPDGELAGFIGAATDITVAKEARARPQAAGRGTHRRTGPPRSPVPRGVRSGAGSHGTAGAGRHRAGGQQPARDLAPSEPRRGDRQEAVGRADAAGTIRSTSRS